MKDPKNIELLNMMVTYYITLHGLQGVPLEIDNPFSQYFTEVALKGSMFYLMNSYGEMLQPDINSRMIVSTSIFHELIKEGYEFYKTMDDYESTIHPIMKEQVTQQLGDMKFNEFLSNAIDIYKTSFFKLINNYNSNKEKYINIKIKLLEDKMEECVEIENYEMAAEIRDKIKEVKSRI